MNAVSVATQHRNQWRASVLLACIFFILAGATGCSRSEADDAAVAFGPFAGVMVHDFGRVELPPGQSAEVEHRFELTNASDRVVVIDEIHSTCGCSVGEVSAREIAPGERFTVSGKLRLSRQGERTADLRILYLAEDNVEPSAGPNAEAAIAYVPLTLRGYGFRRSSVFASHRTIDLRTKDTASFLVVATFEQPLAAPEHVAHVKDGPDWVEVEVGPWRGIAPNEHGHARRFHSRVQVRRTSDEVDWQRILPSLTLTVEGWGSEMRLWLNAAGW